MATARPDPVFEENCLLEAYARVPVTPVVHEARSCVHGTCGVACMSQSVWKEVFEPDFNLTEVKVQRCQVTQLS
ncbi:hypothetical protein RZS08_27550, partial [Arthrospira platensis SPKY1]|nr:hypothetical protein [Arthrospira platensis SPKY1]